MKTSDVEALKVIVKRHRWTLEELTVDQKQQEANMLISGSTNSMYAYLKERLGSGESVLTGARDILRWQRARRKTLCMGTLVSDLQDQARKLKG